MRLLKFAIRKIGRPRLILLWSLITFHIWFRSLNLAGCFQIFFIVLKWAYLFSLFIALKDISLHISRLSPRYTSLNTPHSMNRFNKFHFNIVDFFATVLPLRIGCKRVGCWHAARSQALSHSNFTLEFVVDRYGDIVSL